MEKTRKSLATNIPLICPSCDSGGVVESWIEEKFEYGSGQDTVTLTAHVPLCYCGACKLEFTDYRSEEIRHAAVCNHFKLLTPAEIVAVRERHHMHKGLQHPFKCCVKRLEFHMRVLQSTPSVAAYKRALRAKLGLRGKALERAARVAAKYGNVNAVLRAAAGF